MRQVHKKESVEMIPVYHVGGSDKTQAKINDTMPHTCIAWSPTQNMPNPIHIQEMSVVRYPLALLKLSDFLQRTAKTLSICQQPIRLPMQK